MTLYVCHLTAAYNQAESRLVQLDERSVEVMNLAAAKPWYPLDYSPSPNDDSVAYRWDNDIGKCQSESYGYCWGMHVLTRDGCPSSLYAEISILSGDTVISYANDTLSGLQPGDEGELAFVSYESGYGQLQGRLTEINCY
jgi:hypothetical protein